MVTTQYNDALSLFFTLSTPSLKMRQDIHVLLNSGLRRMVTVSN